MAADIEREIKLRLPSAEAGRAALTRLGAREVRPRGFEDNQLFDDAAASLAGQGRVLRLRRMEQMAWLTHKAPHAVVDGVKARRETEVALDDPDSMRRLLHELGFVPAFRYQKYRTTFAHGAVEIVLDETPIGVFLEIEGPDAAIHATAQALGFSRQDYIADSYVGLFFAGGGEGDMVF